MTNILVSYRGLLEYCVPVWHFSRGMPYSIMLFAANLITLTSRREEMVS